MNIKSMLILGLKIVTLTLVMFILNAVGDALFSAQSVATEVNSEESTMSALGLLVVCLIDTLILTYFILRSRLSGLRLMVVVALVFYGVKTFTSMLEAWYFVTSIPPGELPGMFLFTVPMTVIFPLIAVPLLGRARKRLDEDDLPNTRLVMPIGQLLGKVTFLSAIVYSVLFWAFGYYIALRNPDLTAFYGVTRPDSFIAYVGGVWTNTPITFVFEIFRGALWIALAAPVIRTTRGKVWEAGLIVALLFSLVQNDVHLIPNPVMPPSVQMSHFIETASSNFIYAVIITWMMHRSHSSLRDLFNTGRASKRAESAAELSAFTN